MRIVVDRGLCELHGQCEYVAPELFHIDEDGELVVVEDVPEELAVKARLAVKVCPALALAIEE
jgi:ferredoxin